MRRKSSGAKWGMPVNCSSSPSVNVSPIWMVPWLYRPMMSPDTASSTSSRSPALNVTASEIRTSLPIRTWRIFMPLV